MTQTFASPHVVCRPALPRDHADVAEFCKGIWEGGDYVPDVWPHWFDDPNGVLVTAEYKGHAIGCAKLSLIDEGQWWLEGVRVDPNYQGLKVASRMHNYLTDYWVENYEGTLRLLTENPAMEHLCLKTGYVKTHELRGYRAKPIAELSDHFSPATDTHEAAAFATESETLQRTGGLIDFGWRIGTAGEHIFEIYSGYKADSPALALGRLAPSGSRPERGASVVHTFYWWKDKQGLFSAWEDEEEDKRQLVLGVLACNLDDMSALLMDIRRFAARKQFDKVFFLAFLKPELLAPLEQAGFSTSWENYLRLFERKR
jgi:RimJ/RimL family protein N-acetyltransferase